MKKLAFYYQMSIAFDSPAAKQRFTLKCIPQSNEMQKICGLDYKIWPADFLSEGRDSFGNIILYGSSENPHDIFSINVTGTAQTGLSESMAAPDDWMLGLYRAQTRLTSAGENIRRFVDEISPDPQRSDLYNALLIQEGLGKSFAYKPNMTHVGTTAEEAMETGCGVCQDYAHIMLAACRMQKIACRYVVGMLMGEGQSHAWVEILDNGRWIALDPTNQCRVGDQHIKISAGRDAADCLINRGFFFGCASQTQQVCVSVNELG